nr:MAG TPA: putative internal virion protein B [Caudoviricetes sp.]
MSGVVIGVGAAVGAVVGGGSTLYSASKTNRNQIKAFKKQMYYMQLNYNYNQAALNRQERSLYDSAVGNLFNMSVNAFQNQSQVEAAQAESGVEGRTQDKLGQVIRGKNLRQQTALKEAYEVDVWNVRSQKEALYIETKNAVEQARDNLSNSFIKGSKLYAQLFQGVTTGAALGAATAGIGSAVGGALGGAASSAAASTATGASAGIGGAGAVSTSLGSGFLSSYGLAANGAVAGGVTTAASTGLSSGALAGIGGAGALASTGMSGASSSATIASNTGGNILGNVMANYQQYKPYVDFIQQWSNYYNSNVLPRERGGYFY